MGRHGVIGFRVLGLGFRVQSSGLGRRVFGGLGFWRSGFGVVDILV